MPFFVGIGLFVVGGLIAWGAISGRLAAMLGAIFTPSAVTASADTSGATDSQFQQLAIPQVQVN